MNLMKTIFSVISGSCMALTFVKIEFCVIAIIAMLVIIGIILEQQLEEMK